MTDTNYKFEVGGWYRMRDGLSAQILDDNFKGPSGQVIAGKLRNKDGNEFTLAWYGNGRCIKDQESQYDLMPPVETKELWVNVYPSSGIGDYESKSIADEYAVHSRIGLLKITIAGDDFTVEKVAI